MRPIHAVRQILNNSDAVVQGIANQSAMINEKLEALIQGLDNQSKLLSEELKAIVQGIDNQSKLLDDKLDKLSAILQKIGDTMDAFIEAQRAQYSTKRDRSEPRVESLNSISMERSANR